MRTLKIAPFGGVITSVDSHEVPLPYGSSASNVDYEDGKLKPRRGFRTFSTLTGKTNNYGLNYVSGFTAEEKNFIDEYVAFLEDGGEVKPYRIDPDTGFVTQIYNDGQVATVPPYPTLGFSFNEASYFFQTNGSSTFKVRRHVIGNNDSFEEIAVPDKPPLYSFGATPILVQDTYTNWTEGADPLDLGEASEFVVGGTAQVSGSSVSGSKLTISHTGAGEASFKIILNNISVGTQDWKFNDRFQLKAAPNSQQQIDMTGILKMTVTNSDGKEMSSTKIIQDTVGPKNYEFNFVFDGKNRDDWGAITSIKFDYQVVFSGGTIDFWFMPGGVDQTDDQYFDTPGPYYYGMSYYNIEEDLESDITTTWAIEESNLSIPIGTWTEISWAPVTDPSVTHVRIYIKNNQFGTWHLIETVAANASPYINKFSYLEMMGFPEPRTYPFKSTEVLYATPFKGWVVWGYKGDYQNIRHTRVGSAVQQSSDLDTEDDFSRGATFSLIQDEPIFMAECGDSLMICGRHGVYAQIGNAPYLMTPPKRLPGSYGVSSAFGATRWLDDEGRIGVAALSYNLEGVYFYSVSEGFGEEEGYKPVELTAKVRPSIKEFLIEGQGDTIESARENIFLAVDKNQDALWVIYKKRAMVLRRKSLVDGTRQWHFYEYALDNILYPAFSTRRWLKWADGAREIHEVEFDTSRNAFIEGINRDGGNPIPEDTIYFQTKTFRDLNRRIFSIRREAENLEDDLYVEIESTRRTKKYQFPFRKRHVRIGVEQSGYDHRFKFFLPENASPISAFFIEETIIGQRKTS